MLNTYANNYKYTYCPKSNVTHPKSVSIKPFDVGHSYFMINKYTREEIYKKSGIYAIKNIINSRVYIGSSNNLYKRFNAHKNELLQIKHDNPALTNFCKVYGIEKLYIEIIEFCETSILIERENYYIQLYNAYGHGFNCCPKAESPFKNTSPSAETRKKLSDATKRRILLYPEKNKENLNKARLVMIQMYKDGLLRAHNLGKKTSDEAKQKQSLAKKGKPSHLNANAWKIIRAKRKLKCQGEGSHYAKLNEKQVLEIRTLLNEGKMLKKDIAKMYNVSPTTMCDINKRKSWNHI